LTYLRPEVTVGTTGVVLACAGVTTRCGARRSTDVVDAHPLKKTPQITPAIPPGERRGGLKNDNILIITLRRM